MFVQLCDPEFTELHISFMCCLMALCEVVENQGSPQGWPDLFKKPVENTVESVSTE
jgi:hypothetical protein